MDDRFEILYTGLVELKTAWNRNENEFKFSKWKFQSTPRFFIILLKDSKMNYANATNETIIKKLNSNQPIKYYHTWHSGDNWHTIINSSFKKFPIIKWYCQ